MDFESFPFNLRSLYKCEFFSVGAGEIDSTDEQRGAQQETEEFAQDRRAPVKNGVEIHLH